jgi:hypothetical protein
MEEFQRDNEKILLLISNKYKIDLNELITDVLEINPNFVKKQENRLIEPDETKCIALIQNKDKDIRQCSRSIKINGFCKTHNKRNEENNLLFGIIIPKASSARAGYAGLWSIKQNNEKTVIPEELLTAPVEISNNINIKVQRIVIDCLEYKINPLNNFIYDFNSNKLIGKLDYNRHIIENF